MQTSTTNAGTIAPHRADRARKAARLAITAGVTYHLIMTALIFLRPDINPTLQPISEYAIGQFGWIMIGAFLISATSYAALFAAIRSSIRGARGKLGLMLLLICMVGTIVVGVFVSDPIGTPAEQITKGTIVHTIGGSTALFLLPFAALLINLDLAGNPAWAGARPALLRTAAVPLVGFVLFVVSQLVLSPIGPAANNPAPNYGWPPRFLLLTYLAWLVTVARQAIRIEDD